MSLQDPLSDLFSRIRNAQMRYKPIVSSPVSKLRENILEVLKKEGYIRGYARTKHSSGREELDIELKYDEKGPVFQKLQEFQNQAGVFIPALEESHMYIMALGFQLSQPLKA